MAIHCDPQHASEVDWISLTALVDAADLRDQKLTIQLNPAWETVINAQPGRVGKISVWANRGHEISGHHHVLDHVGGWDGYSNESGAESEDDYLGDMQAFVSALEAMLPASIGVTSISSKDYDFPSGVPYQTGGSDSTIDPDDAASVPTEKILNGASVWNLDHSALIAGGAWQVEGMKNAFNAATSDQAFGVAFHPNDYHPGNRTEVDVWLDFLLAADPDASRSDTASGILNAHLASLEAEVPVTSFPFQMLQIAGLLGLGLLVLRRFSSE